MSFELPQAFLLLIPLAAIVARYGNLRKTAPAATVARCLVLLLLVAALARPVRRGPGEAVDVILVVDRSQSMPPDAAERIRELIDLAESQRPNEGRLGIVSFGLDVRVERLPESAGRFGGFEKPVDSHGSSLGEAVETAAGLVDPSRSGRLVLLTDGEWTGRSPEQAIPALLERGTPVDYRRFSRPKESDVAILSIDHPPEADAGSAFRFSASLYSEEPREIAYRLFSGKRLLTEGKHTVRRGVTVLPFRDRAPDVAALSEYRLEIEAEGDPIPENNVARSWMRVRAAGRLLVINADGSRDSLVEALEASGIAVEVTTAKGAPATAPELDPYRAVVLEDVPASSLGPRKMQALRRAVEEAGAGLLVTGGKQSFGVGGYYLSELDPVLPVSLEMRQEHRKFRMAMAIALDRSGSMAVPVGGGMQKMDLANRGAAEAIRLLGPTDEVAVVAVDSAAHVIQRLTKVDDPDKIISRVLEIESMGGGIFVYTALRVAGDLVSESDAATRHIILFADAADAEEPGDYTKFLEACRGAGITVSVIGLGSETDSDAAFLKDIAWRGSGRVFFAQDPADIPRLFTQETLTVSRSTYVSEVTGTQWMPDRLLIGEPIREAFPSVSGYNLTYLRPAAALGAVTTDEYAAPLFAFWNRGAGRVAAFTAQAAAAENAAFVGWPRYGDFFATAGRWLVGQPETRGVSVDLRREGSEGVLTVEWDPESVVSASRDPAARILAPGETESDPPAGGLDVSLRWVDTHRLEGRFALTKPGAYLGVVQLGGKNGLFKAPPVALPYSPEFLPDPRPDRGKTVLEKVARETGGTERVVFEGLFAAPERGIQRVTLVPLFLLVALLVFLTEVAARRLELWSLPQLLAGRIAKSLGRLKQAVAPRRIPTEAEVPSVSPIPPALPSEEAREAESPAAKPASRPREPVEAPPSQAGEPAAPAPSLDMALKRAKRRAEDRLGGKK